MISKELFDRISLEAIPHDYDVATTLVGNLVILTEGHVVRFKGKADDALSFLALVAKTKAEQAEGDEMYMPPEAHLLVNGMQTPDGTKLYSRHRHDYVTYFDKVTGKKYMVDGGLDYCRRSGHEDCKDLTVYYHSAQNGSVSKAAHEHNREHAVWGTYGLKGEGPLMYVKVKDMDSEHMKKVIELEMNPTIRAVMVEELRVRRGND